MPSLACLMTGVKISFKVNLPKRECASNKPATVPGSAEAL